MAVLQRATGAARKTSTATASILTLASAVAVLASTWLASRAGVFFVPVGRIHATSRAQLASGVASSPPATIGGSRWTAADASLLGAAALALAGVASRRSTAVPRHAQEQELRPRDGKRVGDTVWFDVALALPLGLGLADAPRGDGVVVEEVRNGGSAAEHNKKHMVGEVPFRRQHWLQDGDQLLMVNGVRCSSTEEAVALITGAPQGEDLQLKFVRKCNGNVKVLFPESDAEVTAPYQARVSQAAEVAGHPVDYKCTDGTCGSCWRMDGRSSEVYILCQEDCVVGQVPSQTMYREDSIFWDEKEYRARLNSTPNYDNTEPLILKSCPEVYADWKRADPAQGLMAEARDSRLFSE